LYLNGLRHGYGLVVESNGDKVEGTWLNVRA
jgi:hypothetical protein